MKNLRKPLAVFLLSAGMYFFAPDSMTEPCRRSAAIFVFAALSWAMEVFPLHATALLVVFIQIILLAKPDGVLQMGAAGYESFLLPFGSPIIVLFLGGLMMAAALQKYKIDRLIAVFLLKIFGRKPYFVMLGFICVTGFLSMWMSNTAATAMMMAMMIPVICQLQENDPYRKALTLSIPFAANIGGIGTPIGTPPNAIALGLLANMGIQVSFFQWMKLAVPLMLILLVGVSLILYFLFPSKERQINIDLHEDFKADAQTKIVMVIISAAVLLWLSSEWHHMPSSLIALLAMGALSASQIITKDDLQNIDWDVLILMWGGLSLGKGMELSGLTQWVVGLPIFNQTGFLLVAVFALLTIGISTFMSNTATANLVIPIVMLMPGENQIALAVVAGLCCSFAMALPISTPPNAIAFSSRMINSRDMLKAGGCVSALALATILLGYWFIIPAVLGR
jgi:sodium-dependent dicarboxylate transporter 2/3/5